MTQENLTKPLLPAWVLAISGMFSVQLGSALSIPLIKEVGPAGTAWLRLTAGAIIFVIFAKPRRNMVSKKDLPALFALGISTGLVTIAFLAAIQRIPLGTTVAIEFLGPLTVATIRSHNRKAMVWPFLAFVGVLLLTKPWLGEIDLIGVAFAAFAAIGWAVYILLTSWLGDRFTGITGLAFTIPIAAITAGFIGFPAALPSLSPQLMLQAVGLAILLPVLPFVLELKALRGMSEAAFGTLMSLEPAFGTLLGILILDQQINVSQFVGIAFVVIAGVGSQRVDKLRVDTPEIEII